MRIILQPYQRVSAASRITGLSEHKLRCGCKDGTIPHIRSGGIFYVDIPALWDAMDAGMPDEADKSTNKDTERSGKER